MTAQIIDFKSRELGGVMMSEEEPGRFFIALKEWPDVKLGAFSSEAEAKAYSATMLDRFFHSE